jgi:GDSL-like lipase/acylhydrolase family protein
MPHVVLVGDSILDNATYTRGGPDVVSQVRGLLPPDWETTLLAVDGSTTDHVPDQIARLPKDATHLVLSVGGNNALMHMGVLEFPVSSMAMSIGAWADIAADFEARYRVVISACLNTGLPLAVCTVYNGHFEDRSFQRIASATLTVFNDAIIRVAIEHALPVIDLRAVCVDAEDYANPIEPSSVGGAKIARVIVGLVTGATSAAPATRIVVA